MTDRPTSATIGIHLNAGEIVGEILHQKHEHSGGLYPVVNLGFGDFAFTVYPDRERAVELADVLTRMAEELRAGAESFAVQALAD